MVTPHENGREGTKEEEEEAPLEEKWFPPNKLGRLPPCKYLIAGHKNCILKFLSSAADEGGKLGLHADWSTRTG